ncbi:hypothetical protein [Chryseobacterium aquaticum]|nr:hypothetical protein [Chryseobacterium aquaticum]
MALRKKNYKLLVKKVQCLHEIVWKLVPKKENLDFTEIVVNIANGRDINLNNYDVLQIDDYVFGFRDEIVEHLIRYGFNSLFSTDFLFKHIVKRGLSTNKISEITKIYVDQLNLTDELIIIDSYFFAKPKNPDYVKILVEILNKHIFSLKTTCVITNSFNIDVPTKKTVSEAIQNKNKALDIIHSKNNDYHDRFWINRLNRNGNIVK